MQDCIVLDEITILPSVYPCSPKCKSHTPDSPLSLRSSNSSHSPSLSLPHRYRSSIPLDLLLKQLMDTLLPRILLPRLIPLLHYLLLLVSSNDLQIPYRRLRPLPHLFQQTLQIPSHPAYKPFAILPPVILQ